MLAEKFAADLPLPEAGSVGYLRGTAQRARVLRRHAPNAAGERECLVQLFERFGLTWHRVPGSSGNTVVEERDLFPTEEDAVFCGKPARARRQRKSRR